jgi:hypothetical protein
VALESVAHATHSEAELDVEAGLAQKAVERETARQAAMLDQRAAELEPRLDQLHQALHGRGIF